MRQRGVLLWIFVRCLLALSAAWAQEECEEANRELRSCSAERGHLSQQLSETGIKIKGLQQSIKGLESDLQEQQRMCRESSEESQVECGKKMQDLDAQVKAATQELKLSRERISGLTADLQVADRIKSELQEERNRCETQANQEQTQNNQRILELKNQVKSAEDAREQSENDVSALSTAREQVAQLRTDLHEERTQCKTESFKIQEECANQLEMLQQKLQAGEAVKEQVAQLRTDLHEERTQCKTEFLRIREECNNELEMRQEKLHACEAVQGQVAQLRTDLHEERTQCKTESLRIRKECTNELDMLQEKHASAAGDKETLSFELQTCQSTLGEELEVRKQAEAKAALHETLHTKISSDLKVQEQELAKHSDGMKVEISQLQSKLTQLAEQLRFAEQAYLPMWSIPYYDAAATQAAATKEQAVKYYEREIATGKAFQETKKTVTDASDRFITMTEPHVSRAKVVLMPILESAAVKFKSAREVISSQLQKEQYRALVQSAEKVQDMLLATWVRTKVHVAGIYESDMMRQASDDLTRAYTLLLGANVSGSGIDLAIPAMMAKYTLLAIPLLLLLPILIMCCSRPRQHKEPPQAIKPKAQPGNSKGGEGKRNKRR